MILGVSGAGFFGSWREVIFGVIRVANERRRRRRRRRKSELRLKDCGNIC